MISEIVTPVWSSQRETEIAVAHVRALGFAEVILTVTAACASVRGARGSIQLMRTGIKGVSRALSSLLT